MMDHSQVNQNIIQIIIWYFRHFSCLPLLYIFLFSHNTAWCCGTRYTILYGHSFRLLTCFLNRKETSLWRCKNGCLLMSNKVDRKFCATNSSGMCWQQKLFCSHLLMNSQSVMVLCLKNTQKCPGSIMPVGVLTLNSSSLTIFTMVCTVANKIMCEQDIFVAINPHDDSKKTTSGSVLKNSCDEAQIIV